MAKKSPSNSAVTGPQKWIIRAVLGAIIVVPFVAFPPIRISSLKAAKASAEAGVFNAREFANKFWSEKLMPGLGAAVDARTLDAALAVDPTTAAKKYARSVGIGGTSYYFISGEGTVTAADDDGVSLSLAEGAKATIVLDTGLIFGNSLRDGTGLLDVNIFANSEEFNAIAAELNTIVETSVLPAVKKSGTVGAKLHFVGIAELIGTDNDPRPLHLIPIKVEPKP
jgi:predicted lipoprotein